MQLNNGWESVSFAKRDRLPERSGVYMVRSFGKTYYVGRSNNLRRRWLGTAHHRYVWAKNLPACELQFKVIPDSQTRTLEKILIDSFNPPWNNTPIPKRNRWFGLWCRIWRRRSVLLRLSRLNKLDTVDLCICAAIAGLLLFKTDAIIAAVRTFLFG